ncbi:MAG: hypothetical protein JW728_03400 [Candidatus Aureabacteria bacterium]|nr:hypothetical protein [Candidatus Auribacterota bacterium]
MKKIFLNVVVLIISALLALAILKSFISFRNKEMAELYKGKYLWKKAEYFFQKSIKADPYDSSCYSDYADFLLYQSDFAKNAGELLVLSENLYEKASSLNPYWQEYPLKLGQIKIKLAILSGEKAPEGIKKLSEDAILFFRKAHENDPFGFNTSYITGYYGIQIYNMLNSKDRDFIARRLKYSLNERPWYSAYIYPIVWNSTGLYDVLREVTPDTLIANELLFLFMTQDPALIKQWHNQYEKIQGLKQNTGAGGLSGKAARIHEIKSNVISGLNGSDGKFIDRDGWIGVSEDGGQDISDGNMFFNGIVFGALKLRSGRSVITVSARASKAGNMWPYMVVLLEDEIIGETFVETDEWKNYIFNISSGGGVKIVSVMFINDGGNGKEDRNLYIGDAWVESAE